MGRLYCRGFLWIVTLWVCACSESVQEVASSNNTYQSEGIWKRQCEHRCGLIEISDCPGTGSSAFDYEALHKNIYEKVSRMAKNFQNETKSYQRYSVRKSRRCNALLYQPEVDSATEPVPSTYQLNEIFIDFSEALQFVREKDQGECMHAKALLYLITNIVIADARAPRCTIAVQGDSNDICSKAFGAGP